jgi:hypothetical protein
VLSLRIELRSARYQRAARPLSYDSGGEPSNRNSRPFGRALLSREAGCPEPLTLQMAEGDGIEPLTSRSPWVSNPVADPSAAPSLLVDSPYPHTHLSVASAQTIGRLCDVYGGSPGGERVVSIAMPCGTRRVQAVGRSRPASLSNLVSHQPVTSDTQHALVLTGETQMADSVVLETKALRPQSASNGCSRPGEFTVQTGTPGGTRTPNIHVLSVARLPNCTTGANWCGWPDSNRHARGSAF